MKVSEFSPPSAAQKTDAAKSRLLPGMAIISLWMLAEAGMLAFGVFRGAFPWPTRNAVLGIATILLGCGLGLMQRRRWGWALSLAMAFMLMCYYIFAVTRLHAPQALVMAFVNTIFFLYLVRPEVRTRLR